MTRTTTTAAGGTTRRSGTGSGTRRVILFPTEPTSIDPKKIDEAVKRVLSQKK